MTPSIERWKIATPEGETGAAWDPADDRVAGTEVRDPHRRKRTVFVCAHGAGGHMDDRSILAISASVRPRGIDVVRFNFFYRQRRAARPDPMPGLLSCFAAVVARAREQIPFDRLIIGGRSMGGRAASVLAADGYPCDGLLLLAYPLHPPGRPDQLRTAHLSAITTPVLCFSGTRDSFCRRDLMEAALARLGPRWEMHWLEGADHSFHVLKRSGRTDSAVLADVADLTANWLGRLESSARNP